MNSYSTIKWEWPRSEAATPPEIQEAARQRTGFQPKLTTGRL
jgi:hypothetical protein